MKMEVYGREYTNLVKKKILKPTLKRSYQTEFLLASAIHHVKNILGSIIISMWLGTEKFFIYMLRNDWMQRWQKQDFFN